MRVMLSKRYNFVRSDNILLPMEAHYLVCNTNDLPQNGINCSFVPGRATSWSAPFNTYQPVYAKQVSRLCTSACFTTSDRQ